MIRALELAEIAAAKGEVPVGAVVVKDGVIVGEGFNLRENSRNALSHAETEAIHSACNALGSWRLDGCSLYTTLEPCVMCTGAIISSRISELVFGAYDLELGCADSKINLFSELGINGVSLYGGICEEECKKLLDRFFNGIRNKRGTVAGGCGGDSEDVPYRR